MSALGDYVHLRTSNYIKYGTNISGEKEPYVAINDFKAKRFGALPEIKESVLETLKLRVSADSDYQKKRDSIQNAKWEEVLKQVWQTLSFFTTKKMLDALNNEKDENFTTFTNKYRLDKEELKLVKKSTLTLTEINKKKQDKKKLDDLIKKINQNGVNGNVTEEQLKEVVTLFNRLGTGVTLGKITKSELEGIESALVDLAYDTYINALAGDFGEHLIYSARDTNWGLALDEANKVIEEKVVGNQESDIQFQVGDLAVDLHNYKPQVFSYKDKNTKQTYFIGKSKDKVDVQIIIDQTPLFASVKNYKDLSASPNVNLQRKVNLLYSLIFLNNFDETKNFGNHWLNLHAHVLRVIKNHDLESDKENADEILTQEIAYEALVIGNPLKQNINPANLFVAIDRRSGKVYAQSTKTILEKKFEQISITPKVSNIRFLNAWQFGKKDRIARLLVRAHEKNFQVDLKVGQLMGLVTQS